MKTEYLTDNTEKSTMTYGFKSFVEQSAYYWRGDNEVFLPMTKCCSNKPLAIDLFCGLGGLSIGFENAGFGIGLGIDIHKPSVETFRGAHPEAAVILGDIRKILSINSPKGSANIILKTLESIVSNREIDVLMAGIPCQGFSLANRKRDVLDERNYLFLHFMEAIRLIRPKYVLIENVTGLGTLNNGSFVESIKEAMRELGYTVEHKLLNAADFGVPQIRKRMIFLGARQGYPIIWPVPTFGTKANPYRTVKDAIYDLPRLKASEKCDQYSIRKKSNDYQKMMRGTCVRLLNHKTPSHPKSVIRKIKNTKPGEPMYVRYKQRIRLSWKLPSPTQVSGGIRPQFQFGHPRDWRGLTVRERARIQSIPDWIEIRGGIVQGRVQTGNAVPPLLAESIANTIYMGLYLTEFKCKLMQWVEEHIRNFPWRNKSTSPYEVLISEILLRKTRVESVSRIYTKFIYNYPTLAKLKAARIQDLRKMLNPLGLSRIRAKALKGMSEILTDTSHNQVCIDVSKLMEIPHVGRYIANATVMFGHNIRRPIVDENVQRVLNRIFSIPKAIEIHKADYLWNMMNILIPQADFKRFCWGFLDFAALVCKPQNPSCGNCPMSKFCHHYLKMR